MRPPAEPVADILNGGACDIPGRRGRELEATPKRGGRRGAVEPRIGKLFAGKAACASNHHARAIGRAAKRSRPACNGGGALREGANCQRSRR